MNMAKKTKKNKGGHMNGDKGEAPEVQTSDGEDAAKEPKEPARDENPLEQAERKRDKYLGNSHRARTDYQNLKRRTFDDVQGAVGRELPGLAREPSRRRMEEKPGDRNPQADESHGRPSLERHVYGAGFFDTASRLRCSTPSRPIACSSRNEGSAPRTAASKLACMK